MSCSHRSDKHDGMSAVSVKLLGHRNTCSLSYLATRSHTWDQLWSCQTHTSAFTQVTQHSHICRASCKVSFVLVDTGTWTDTRAIGSPTVALTMQRVLLTHHLGSLGAPNVLGHNIRKENHPDGDPVSRARFQSQRTGLHLSARNGYQP